MLRLNRGVEPVTLRSIWDLIQGTASSWSEINAPRLGAALAFYTMLSIAPLLVVSIGIAGLAFGQQAAEGRIVDQIRGLVGTNGGEIIKELLRHAAKPAAGILAATLGFFVLLF